MRGLSLVAASGGHSSSRCPGLSLSQPLFVAEHRLQTRRLSSCGSRAQSLRGMWDLPRPGLEPVSPALAGRFSTTAPRGKPPAFFWGRNYLRFTDWGRNKAQRIRPFPCLHVCKQLWSFSFDLKCKPQVISEALNIFSFFLQLERYHWLLRDILFLS